MTTPTAPSVIPGPPGGGSEPPRELQRQDGYEPAPLGVPTTVSSYLEFRPGIYESSEFLGRFLLIFEHILSPIDRTVGNIADYFDASVTPEEFLPWLGSWLGLVIDGRMPVENRREIVRRAPELYRWRGTRRGMREFLQLATGLEPEIIEPTLSDIAGNRNLAYRFTVRFRVPAGTTLTRSYVEALVEAEKPAFAGCAIEIVNG